MTNGNFNNFLIISFLVLVIVSSFPSAWTMVSVIVVVFTPFLIVTVVSVCMDLAVNGSDQNCFMQVLF